MCVCEEGAGRKGVGQYIERVAPYGGGTDRNGKMPPLDPIAVDKIVRPLCKC